MRTDDLARRIDDAFLPATRHTTDDALKKRGCGQTSEGRRFVNLHARVLAEAIRQDPSIAALKLNACRAAVIAQLTVLDDLEDRLYRRER